MELIRQLRALRDGMVHHAPILGPWIERHYRRRFARQRIQHNAYYGVYPDYASAVQAAPTSLPTGYDHAETALQYAAWTNRVFAFDYPAMFWLNQLFAQGDQTVFDLGGSIGIKYYAYRGYVNYPQGLRWTVCDVPAVVAAGADWAATHDAHDQLSLTHERTHADDHDILFASGSLQYLDYPFCDLLAALPHPPRHILVTMLPLHRDRSFFTVQNMGTLYCAYRISARPEFVTQMHELGYTIRDQWNQPDRQCVIPFHPKYRVDGYHGFLFSRTGT